MITITYVHSHKCSRSGHYLEVRPEVNDGVYYPKIPICLETQTELSRVRVETT